MKITNLTLPFILLSIYANSVLSAAPGDSPPVLDITGKKLLSGVNYYILPVFRGRGGGLTMSRGSNVTCPLHVAQAQLEVDNGIPMTFTPVNPKKGVIRVSTDLNVKFSGASTCVQSTVWRLDYDEVIKQYFIATGGVEGNPGIKTTSNWFKIEAYERDYKLVFCPTVCNYCKVICRDVGIYLLDGVRRLALSEVPFRVIFRKA